MMGRVFKLKAWSLASAVTAPVGAKSENNTDDFMIVPTGSL
jgi:hypothetical protein